MTTTHTIDRLAKATPTDRNRWVDALRAMAILVVVFGHWLMAGPEMNPDGTLRIGHLIAESRTVQGLTWVFQVMPVFFFVGGYANAAGWRSARRTATPYAHWLRTRLRRLVTPVLPLLAFWTVAAGAAVAGGVDPDLVRAGSQAALVPVWFLATYVLTVAMAPVTLALWERYGWWVVVTLAVTAGLVDLASIGAGVPLVQWTNYIFVWNAVHALGYAWADGRIGPRAQRLRIGAAGFGLLAAAVATLPYPLAMVGLDAAEITNSNPPRVTLVLLALFQFGIVTAFEDRARRVLERPALWRRVIAVSGVIMTLYLWHLTAMVGVVAAQLALGGVGLHQTVATAGWWATRPLFLLVVGLVTAASIGVLGRFERPIPDRRPAPAGWQPVAGTVLVCAGLGTLASQGIVDGPAVTWSPIALTALGAVVGGVLSLGQRDVALAERE